METLTEHPIEPAVSGPPPRRLSLPPGLTALMTIALLLFVVFFGGGARALWEAGKLGWVAVSGRSVPARITAIDTLPGATSGQPVVQTGLHYAYSTASHPSVGAGTGVLRLSEPAPPENTPLAAVGPLPASASAAPAFHVGDTLMLRRAQWFGQTVLLPWPSNPGGKIAFLAFCGGLIVAVSITLIRRLLGWTVRRVRLLGHGIATVGTITHKHSQAEDAAHYFVSYGYGDAQTPPVPYEHEEQVTADQWKRLEVGQPVTVLYDPAQPSVASLYTLLRGK
jgi:hypothetical protein